MELLGDLSLGLQTALTPANLLLCLAGVLLGTLVGVLPGLGPVSALALLLPFTFELSATGAVITLAGIYYGAQYGGSITAILVNLPGEASSAVTCIDGHAMARQGRAGVALAIAAIGSFVGGTAGTLLVAILSTPLAGIAARFEAADYASLMACGLVTAIVLARGSPLKAIAMALAGLLLGAVGLDLATGQPRFTFGLPQLYDGIGFLPLAVGLFGLAEIMTTLGERTTRDPQVSRVAPARLLPGETRHAAAAMGRGTVIGSVLGALPGGGPLLASFASYALEKKVAPAAPALGSGAIAGVAGPESANNAAAQTSFIPLLTLGLPSNGIMALLLGALVVHGVQPGPDVIVKEPTLFWGLVASMWIGNLLLLLINLPLAGVWARLLRVPYRLLFPTTIVLACVGLYSVSHSTFEIFLATLFGVLGYLLRRRGFEPAPLLLGFVLSQPLEENARRALLFAEGNPLTFLSHPVSAALLATAVLLLLSSILSSVRAARAASATSPSSAAATPHRDTARSPDP